MPSLTPLVALLERAGIAIVPPDLNLIAVLSKHNADLESALSEILAKADAAELALSNLSALATPKAKQEAQRISLELRLAAGSARAVLAKVKS